MHFLLALMSPAEAGEPVVWAGIDYSMVRMIGTGDFNEPSEIFPGYLLKWNALFVEEMVPELARMLHAEVIVDDAGVTAANERASARQIERRDAGSAILQETTISAADLERAVAGYALQSTSGQGLVFVADRLVKLQETGCGWVVWFDVASRDIEFQTRVCAEAGGFGFRNYWFRPFKEMVPLAKKTRPKG